MDTIDHSDSYQEDTAFCVDHISLSNWDIENRTSENRTRQQTTEHIGQMSTISVELSCDNFSDLQFDLENDDTAFKKDD